MVGRIIGIRGEAPRGCPYGHVTMWQEVRLWGVPTVMGGRARIVNITANWDPMTTTTYAIYDCETIEARGRGRSLRVSLAGGVLHANVLFRVPGKPGLGGPPSPGPYPRDGA